MKTLLKILCILLASSITLSSCGVMFGGSKFNGNIIVKNHPKADIYVNGAKAGQGTAVGLYKRDKPLTVEVREEGCESQTAYFDNTFRTGNFILSLATWGFLGLIVDLGTGACYKPDHIHNPNILKTSDKNFTMTVDYTGCKTKDTSITNTND